MFLGSAGCGYHTAGHAGQLAENLTTVAIPGFKNETLTYRIDEMLTSSVVHEFTTRTRYHIISDPNDSPDATLRGTVLSTTATPQGVRSRNGCPAVPPTTCRISTATA